MRTWRSLDSEFRWNGRNKELKCSRKIHASWWVKEWTLEHFLDRWGESERLKGRRERHRGPVGAPLPTRKMC